MSFNSEKDVVSDLCCLVFHDHNISFVISETDFKTGNSIGTALSSPGPEGVPA